MKSATVLCSVLAGLPALAVHAQDHSRHPVPVPPGREPARAAAVPTESERRHVPPDPPQHAMADMSNEQMLELMAMDDNASFGIGGCGPHRIALLH
jgi:hypothetical protein